MQRLTFGEALTQVQRSSNIDIFSDKNDRVTVAFMTDNAEPTAHLDDLLRLYKGTVSQSLADPVYNQIPYSYACNYATGVWTEEEYDNLEDQEKMDEVVPEERLHLYWLRDADMAYDVVEHRASWLDLNAFRFAGEIPLIQTVNTLELAQLVSIEHFGGLKTGGYVDEQFKITQLDMNIDELKYHFYGIRRRVPPPGVITSPDVEGIARINSRTGPWPTANEGELFAVFNSIDDARVMKVWKTTDYGATWAVADAANQPVLTNNIGSYDSHPDGLNSIIIATQEGTTGRVAFHRFDMTTSLWSTVDDEVVSTAMCSGYPCVSICLSGSAPVIYFQGDRVLVNGNYYHRGYVSSYSSGWSAASIVTPDPGDYPENKYWPYAANADSGHCYIQRVIEGASGRLHYFYSLSPSVVWVQWSPDEYAVSDLGASYGGRQFLKLTGVHYPAPRNLGDPCTFNNGGDIAFVRKSYWGGGYVDVINEGEELSERFSVAISGVNYNSWQTDNPSGLVRSIGGRLYALENNWGRVTQLFTSDDEGETWSSGIAAGPQWAYPYALYTLTGNIITVRGETYLSYFTDPDYPTYYWLRVSALPYSS
jgi:hypothetical protein